MPITGTLGAMLASPNIVYLLFLLGIIGVIAESFHPGTLVPGIVGALALVLAVIGFVVLGVSPLGVVVLLAGVALLIVEAHASGIGVFGVGGLIAFIAGSLLLFSPPGERLSPWLIGLGTAIVAGYFFFVLRAVLRARHLPVASGSEALLGREGVALSDLAPRGTVRVANEDWTAVAELDPIKTGESVEVVAVEGVTLHVRRPYEWQLPPVSADAT